jgi:hypothetical protein
MSFSLDTPSIQTLKTEARDLRETRALAGEALSHSAALEQIARSHGYRDWNTASASLPTSTVAPFQVGSKVVGTYLDQPFAGVLMGVQMLGDMQHFRLTIQFDAPVNVTPDFMFANNRHRVVSTVDSHGVSSALRGNGNPQMVVKRA